MILASYIAALVLISLYSALPMVVLCWLIIRQKEMIDDLFKWADPTTHRKKAVSDGLKKDGKTSHGKKDPMTTILNEK